LAKKLVPFIFWGLQRQRILVVFRQFHCFFAFQAGLSYQVANEISIRIERTDLSVILKKLLVPRRLLATSALLGRLPARHRQYAAVEQAFSRRLAGWRGEQQTAYYLHQLSIQSCYCLHNLRLVLDDQVFEIDLLILTPRLIIIVEVKNFSGALHFDPIFNQLIRTDGDRQEGFSNPLLQADRQRRLLRKWFAAHRLPLPPISYLVVIAHASTLISTSANGSQIGNVVCHAEQLEKKLTQLLIRHTANWADDSQLRRIGALLAAQHIEAKLDPFTRFNVAASEIFRGIYCPDCLSFQIERHYGSWFCRRCGRKAKNDHISAVLDYFLLFGPTMTNTQCRQFLQVDSHQLVTRLLRQMALPSGGNGQGIGRYYLAPSHEFFQQNYMFVHPKA
jgi:hypothetical protein